MSPAAHANTTPAEVVFACAAGLIPLEVDFYQGHGDQNLRLEWQGPGQPAQRIPAAAYFRTP